MLTFRQYITEENTGNYVSVDVASDLPSFGLPEKYPDYKVCSRHDQHVTLIYSPTTNMPLGKVAKFLKTLPSSFKATVSDVAAFDAVPKDGERDENACTIVLKLKSPELNGIHDDLKKLGLKHTYDEFSPHVSLIYGFPRDKKEECLEFIRLQIKDGLSVSLRDFKNNKIIKNWADKLEK